MGVDMSKEAVRARVMAVLKEKELYIHPQRSQERFEKFLDNIANQARCPCNKTRPACPCDESPAEIARDGTCDCKFIVTKEYIQKYSSMAPWRPPLT
ncbi:MAG: hypothetical protein HYY29_04450 [Chloroflexi bacterium]|nr:hypothetical protein [Chloroflexota bacterium]